MAWKVCPNCDCVTTLAWTHAVLRRVGVSSTADVEGRWGTSGLVGMKPLESGHFLGFFHYNVSEVVACIQAVGDRPVTIVAEQGVF